MANNRDKIIFFGNSKNVFYNVKQKSFSAILPKKVDLNSRGA